MQIWNMLIFMAHFPQKKKKKKTFAKGRRQNSLSVTTNKPQRMKKVADWAYVTLICQWAPAEAMWEVTYGGWG